MWCEDVWTEQKRLLMIYFGLKGRVELQQYYCWYIFYSWIRRKFFSWYIPNSKQVLISEFEAKFIGHFRNENTTFTKIWKLGVSAFLYESFWIIDFWCNSNLMLRSYQSQAELGLLVWMGNSKLGFTAVHKVVVVHLLYFMLIHSVFF